MQRQRLSMVSLQREEEHACQRIPLALLAYHTATLLLGTSVGTSYTTESHQTRTGLSLQWHENEVTHRGSG